MKCTINYRYSIAECCATLNGGYAAAVVVVPIPLHVLHRSLLVFFSLSNISDAACLD
jgi:hypothetical protein